MFVQNFFFFHFFLVPCESDLGRFAFQFFRYLIHRVILLIYLVVP